MEGISLLDVSQRVSVRHQVGPPHSQSKNMQQKGFIQAQAPMMRVRGNQAKTGVYRRLEEWGYCLRWEHWRVRWVH